MSDSKILPTLLRGCSTLILLVIIAYLSLTPAKGSPSVYLFDYVLHALAYGALSTPYSFSKTPNRLYIFVGTCSWGIAIELIQPYVGRTCDIYDVFANSTGTLLALLIVPKIYSLIFASISTDQQT